MINNKIVGKNYFVKEINSKVANELVKKFHYSKKVVKNSKLHLGIFKNENSELVGVLQYGYPMNNNKTISKIGCSNKMYELNRMVMDDEQPRNSESQALSICNKYLKKFTDIDYILSFSDGKESNVGYIYQANNWKYIGYIVSDSFYDLDGEILHNVTIWHKFKENHPLRNNFSTIEIMYNYFDNISKIKSKQHVYLYDIKKNATIKYRNLPYPKVDREKPILQRIWYKKDGIILKCKLIENYAIEKLTPIKWKN